MRQSRQCLLSSVCEEPQNHTLQSFSSPRIDSVYVVGGSRRQVSSTKGFVRPEHLLEGKVSEETAEVLHVWTQVAVQKFKLL